MYTLVSAPVLGFDLVRRPGGEHVAVLLRRALQLGPDDLPVLAAARGVGDASGHEAAWVAVSALEASRRGVRALVGDVYEAAAARAPGGGSVSTTLQALEAAPLGTLSALLRCVREEILDWTWQRTGTVSVQDATAQQATAVLCDAVTAAYWYGLLDPESRRRLAAPWTRAGRALRPARSDSAHAAVSALTDRLARLDAGDLARLRDASVAVRRSGGWARAVHDAAWATHLTGRVRDAADVQLLGVACVLASGVSPADSAAGVWNLVSGALAAQVVADVLSGPVTTELLLPLRLALGLAD